MEMPTKQLRVLLIEDCEDDAILLAHELKRAGFHLDTERVDTELALRKALSAAWDIVFCDYTMPMLNGLDALKIVRDANEEVPFIFVSGTIGEDVAVEAMRTGAQDYILKNNLKRLIPAVERELRESDNLKKRREAEKRLHFLAHYDDLTGLPNRNYFLQILATSIQEAQGFRHSIALAYIDIDQFKTANDSLGYEAGNQLLIQVAERLKSSINSMATVARLAGDEYAVLLRNISDRNQVIVAVERIREAIFQPFDVHGCKIYLGASIGVSIYPDDARNAVDLLRSADITTFRVKQEGGKHYRFYSADMEVNLEERLAMDHAMREALPEQQFVLHFQPQICLRTGEVAAVEALVRWNQGHNKMVPPDKFIPLAEETGFIAPLGEWIMRTACRQTAQWHAQGFENINIAVNLSARQFHQDNLLSIVQDSLQDSGLNAECLELEITETAIIRDSRRALSSLNQLKALGVKVALDDFGTGYSSLSHLKDFMIDTLKIDRSFIAGIPLNVNTTAITAAVIAMAEKLGIRVVAEGVETQEQYQFLKSQECGFAQGYFLKRPVPAEDVFLTKNL